MCGPILAVLGAVVSLAQGAAGFASAQQQADSQNDYYMENARAAQAATRNQYENIQIRQMQEKEASDQKAQENSVAALEKRGQAQVSAGEAGVSGLSVDALVGNLFQQEGRNWMAINTNLQMTDQNLRTEMDNAKAGGQSRINSVRTADNPSPLPFILQGVSGALGAFSKGGTSGSGAA
jgi:hypothetical protein